MSEVDAGGVDIDVRNVKQEAIHETHITPSADIDAIDVKREMTGSNTDNADTSANDVNGNGDVNNKTADGDGTKDDLDEEDDDDEEEEDLNVIIRPIARPTAGPNAYKSVSSNYANKSLTNVSVGAKQPKLGVDLDDSGDINGTPTLEFSLSLVKEEDKPWKIPGADINDYFNYGFTEETWVQYCEKQRSLRQQYAGSLKPLTLSSLSNSKSSRSSVRNPINVIGASLAMLCGVANVSQGSSKRSDGVPPMVLGATSLLSPSPGGVGAMGGGLGLSSNLTSSLPSPRPSSILGSGEKAVGSLSLTSVPPPTLPPTFNPGVPPPNFAVPPPGYSSGGVNNPAGAPLAPNSIVGNSLFNALAGGAPNLAMMPPPPAASQTHPQNILNAMAILQQMNPQQIMAAANALPPHLIQAAAGTGGPMGAPGLPFTSVPPPGMLSGVLNAPGMGPGDVREKTPDSLGSMERDLDDEHRHRFSRHRSRGMAGEHQFHHGSSRYHDATPVKKDREYFEMKDREREKRRMAREALFRSRIEKEGHSSRRRSRSTSRDKELNRDSKRRRHLEEGGDEYGEESREGGRGETRGEAAGSEVVVKQEKVESDTTAEDERKMRRKGSGADLDDAHHSSSSRHQSSRGGREERPSHRERDRERDRHADRFTSESSRRHRREHRSRSRSHSPTRESRRHGASEKEKEKTRSRRSPTSPHVEEESTSRSSRRRSGREEGGDSSRKMQSEVSQVSGESGEAANKATLSKWETEDGGK